VGFINKNKKEKEKEKGKERKRQGYPTRLHPTSVSKLNAARIIQKKHHNPSFYFESKEPGEMESGKYLTT